MGYLVAGLIVGPYIPIPLFADVERVHSVSELGIAFVMFAVGLEFSLKKAAQVLPISGLAAAAQIGGMLWAGSFIGGLMGFSAAGQIAMGASIAVSSTMVVTKVYDLHPPPGDVRTAVLGVLVLQDLVAIVLITLVTAIAQGAQADADAVFGVVGRLVGVTVGVVVVGSIVVPPITRRVAKLDSPEVDVVFAVGLCFALAAAMESLDYSAALGAFLAGMLVSDSGLGKRYEHLVAPLRDVFAAVFFVSVGMTVDPRVAVHHVGESLAIALAVIALQFALVTIAGLLSGLGLRRAAHAGLSLGQVGEFAFIIIGIGVAAGVVPDHMFTVMVIVAVVTTFTTSIGLAHATRIVETLARALPGRAATYLSRYTAWVDGVRERRAAPSVGGGIRRGAMLLAIDATMVGAVVIAAALSRGFLEAWLVERLGTASYVPSLIVLGAAGALAFPFAWGMWKTAATLGTRLGRAIFPESDGERSDLNSTSRSSVSAGIRLASLLVAGLFAIGVTGPFLPGALGPLLLIVALLPAALGLWRSTKPLGEHVGSATLALFAVLRDDPEQLPTDPQIADLLKGLGDVTPLRIGQGDAAVGKSLRALDLRAKSGATVVAIAHPDEDVVAPHGDEELREGDVLGLAGRQGSIALATEILRNGSTPV